MEKQMYKWSKFNIKIEFDNRVFLHNCNSTKSIEIDEIAFEDDRLLNGELDLSSQLIDDGFIVPFELDENEIVFERVNKLKNSRRSLGFTISTTRECNYKCSYCFEKHVLENYKMSCETMDNIVEFIIKQCKERIGSLDLLALQWFGGEPTMNLDAARYITERLDKEYFNYHPEIEVVGTMTTNGRFLSKDVVGEFVQKYHLKKVVVSMDGSREYYTKVKNCKDEDYVAVMQNILDMQDLLHVTVRINIDDNVIEAEKLITELVEKGYRGEILYAHVFDISQTSEDYQKHYEKYVGHAEKLDLFILEKGYDRYFKGIVPSISRMACLATEPWHFTISSAGEIYRCTERLGSKTCIVGNVVNGITNKEVENIFMENRLYEKCYNCAYLPYCLGKCIMERRIEKKGINCEAIKMRTEQKIRNMLTLTEIVG